jgi:alanine racemase
MLYGANPLQKNDHTQAGLNLIPVMHLSASIVALRKIEAGESVGYNGRWTSQRASLIATIGIGYGDGYPRHVANGTPTLVNGQRAPIVGTVSMDLTCIDVTDCPNVKIGDDVLLWGEQLPPEEIADCADTIPYELFTSITKRAEREYIDVNNFN